MDQGALRFLGLPKDRGGVREAAGWCRVWRQACGVESLGVVSRFMGLSSYKGFIEFFQVYKVV